VFRSINSLGLLQSHVTDSLTIAETLGGSGRGGQLDVLDTEVIQTEWHVRRLSGELEADDETGWAYALAIFILVSKLKKALANCSPSKDKQVDE
jgi:hypothetical protein